MTQILIDAADIMTQTLWRRYYDADIMTQALLYDADIMTQALLYDADIMTQILWRRHYDADMTQTLWRRHYDADMH